MQAGPSRRQEEQAGPSRRQADRSREIESGEDTGNEGLEVVLNDRDRLPSEQSGSEDEIQSWTEPPAVHLGGQAAAVAVENAVMVAVGRSDADGAGDLNTPPVEKDDMLEDGDEEVPSSYVDPGLLDQPCENAGW